MAFILIDPSAALGMTLPERYFLNFCLTSVEYYDMLHEIVSRARKDDRKSWFVMNNIMNIAIIIVIGDKMKLP